MRKTVLFVSLGAGALGLAALGGYWLGQGGGAAGHAGHGGAAAAASAPAGALSDPAGWTVAEGEAATRRHIAAGLKAGDLDPQTGKTILYYHDPMAPGKQFQAPGKSPFMDMMLVPVYAGAGREAGTVNIDPRLQQNLGVRVGKVARAPFGLRIEATGAIAFNERRQSVVASRSMGFVEKLYVRAELDTVRQGQALAEIYVPEWVSAQQDYLALRGLPDSEALQRAAHTRMRQAGMSDAQIAHVMKTGKPQARFTLVAPQSGVVTDLELREGATVMQGMTLLRISALDSVWAEAEVPESQISALKPGMAVSASSPAWPGQTFSGRVQLLLPEVNMETRTRRARVEFSNPGLKLVPGMVVGMQLHADSEPVLQVPSEAVIRTGQRALVMLKQDDGRFVAQTVKIGREAQGATEILAGLSEGQQIVLSGQFLIDSEASLKGVEARLPAAEGIRSQVKIEAVNGRQVTLTHPPIPELGWPGMTMEFSLGAALDPKALRAGSTQTVRFVTRDDDVPQIIAIEQGGKP